MTSSTLSSSPDAIRLRQLVRLTDATVESNDKATPTHDELICLIAKQDSIIAELFDELEMCRSEIVSIKTTTIASSANTRQLIEQMIRKLSEFDNSNDDEVRVDDDNDLIQEAYTRLVNAVQLVDNYRIENAMMKAELEQSRLAISKLNDEMRSVIGDSERRIANAVDDAKRLSRVEKNANETEVSAVDV